MKKLLWRQICPKGEQLHIATIELKRMGSPSMHRHDFYECFLVLEGQGTHCTESEELPLLRHRLYCLRPEHAHAIQGQHNLVFLNIAFEASTFEAIQPLTKAIHHHWRPGPSIHAEPIDEPMVNEIIKLVTEVVNERNACNAAWLLLSLDRLLSRPQVKHVQRNLPDWMAEGIARANDGEVLTEGLPALTRVMGRSREHISRSFKLYLGLTPTEWINRERIERACLLLTTTRLSVFEIALDCGFESSSYFHKCFREAMQSTPRQYRQNLMRIQHQ